MCTICSTSTSFNVENFIGSIACLVKSDVQALAHAVDLSRQEAIDSLRYAGGDLTLAFKVLFV